MRQERTTALVADRLIDGTGRDPVTDAVAVWEDDQLTAVGPRSSVRIPPGALVLEGDNLTLLPGLMDLHVHLGAQAGINFPRILMTPASLELLHAVPNCAATLQAGFTTVRDAGLTPVGVKLAVERSLFPGPRMEIAVSILGQTGGHSDPWMPCGVAIPLGAPLDVPDGVVDGIDGMRRKVREVLRAGANWIKLCTSGGVLSASDDPDAAQLTVEEIAVAVYEAAAVGKRCMAHAMSARGIKNALQAGVMTIEHGCFLDEEGIAMMKAKGAALIPTLVAPRDVIAGAERNPGSLPPMMVDKARQTIQQHRASVHAAIESGVIVAMGTDAGVGAHGENARELALMVEAGMTSMQAIEATTRVPAEVLRVQDRLGTLAAGKVADLIALEGDPLADIGLFNDRSRVRLVVKNGLVVRDTTRSEVAAGV
jgi:imidazolonepropionase-like amidohydrolase